ncbi:MAG: glutamine--fructose-6-phosphate transaminase (isomerizing), partial [Pseudomonadales bacterium]
MCGIVGVVAQRDGAEILLEGLRRLEYRGYDSAGLAMLGADGKLKRVRCLGKVSALSLACGSKPPQGQTGIAHTRWATHGQPSETNAHPHLAGKLALVHNGIIENHETLKAALQAEGVKFESETDTEVIAYQLGKELQTTKDLRQAMRALSSKLEGAYALAVIHEDYPGRLLAVRLGSPLVVGLGKGENYIASDPQALRQVTDRFIFLEEGELVDVTTDDVAIFAGEQSEQNQSTTNSIKNRIVTLNEPQDPADKGNYSHYMQKEIFEQPHAIEQTLEGRLTSSGALPQAFGAGAADVFAEVQAVQIVACGSSYYTGLVAKYWFEQYLNMPCQVEIASEFRYRQGAVLPNTLLIGQSQSGETADTLAALRNATHDNYLASLSLCNVPNSSLVRETDYTLMLKAGAEICVASTKAFTSQLTDLLLLVAAIGRTHSMSNDTQKELAAALQQLPNLVEEVLALETQIKAIAKAFADRHHALFLGRGSHYPIALEGALKLKEITYIHAEGYPAGELKHGPLALVDDDMPVVAVAPDDGLIEKLKSNLEEVRARG